MEEVNILTIKKEPIPLQERNSFQVLLIRSMLGKKPEEKTKEEWRAAALYLVDKYAKTVGNIIDDPKNEEIRNLILKGKHKEASDLVVKILKSRNFEMVT